MSGDWLDLILIALIAASAISGYRQGFVVGLLSFVGLVGGGVAGAFLAPVFARHFSGNAEAVVGIVVVFGLASAGRALAGALGGAVRRRLRNNSLRTTDAVGGAAVSVVAVLLVAWFIGSSLVQSPFPAVARAVDGSRVLAAVDHRIPTGVQSWFADFRQLMVDGNLPRVFGALGAERIVPVAPPDPTVSSLPAIEQAAQSIVKVTGDAHSCSRTIEGSGFVYAPDRIMTNAHVVAGVRQPFVQVQGEGRPYPATVVYYDPRVDVAVLAVDGLHAAPLPFATHIAKPGESAVVAGFPEGGPYVATAARIRGSERARGPDIYQDAQVTREIYAVRAEVVPGNSGGPLLDSAGDVDGVVFGKAVGDGQTGYALTAGQVAAAARAGQMASAAVSTQGCD